MRVPRVKLKKYLTLDIGRENYYNVPMKEKDHNYFVKVFALILLSFLAGVSLMLFGVVVCLLDLAVAIALAVILTHIYDKAWDK